MKEDNESRIEEMQNGRNGEQPTWVNECTGHDRIWARPYLGTTVSGHDRIWARPYLGMTVFDHYRIRYN